jgi:hypothetical protein
MTLTDEQFERLIDALGEEDGPPTSDPTDFALLTMAYANPSYGPKVNEYGRHYFWCCETCQEYGASNDFEEAETEAEMHRVGVNLASWRGYEPADDDDPVDFETSPTIWNDCALYAFDIRRADTAWAQMTAAW